MRKKIEIFKKNDNDNDDDFQTLENLLNKEEDLVQTNSFTSTEYIINLDSDIVSPNRYRKIFKILADATEYDIIRFKINTSGGYVDSFIEFYHHIMKCLAPTIAEIHRAYSAGSDIALSCDVIEINEFSSMMIHTTSGGMIGKTDELESYSKFLIKQNKQIFFKMYDGFLSQQEMNDIFKGSDLWLCSSDIEKRLKNWIPIKQRITKNKIIKKKKIVKI